MNIKSSHKIIEGLRALSGFLFAALCPMGHVFGYSALTLGIPTLFFPRNHRENPLPKRYLYTIFLVFFLWGAILSLFVAENRVAAFTTLFSYFAHWTLPFMLGYSISSRYSLRIIFVWIASLLLLGLVSLMPYLGLFEAAKLSSEGLLKGLHTHIQFGTLLLIALHLLLGMFLTAKIEMRKTYIFGFCGLICAFMILLTGSRGVWFAMVFSIFGAFVHSAIARRRRRLSLIFLTLTLLAAVVSIALFPQVRYRIDRTSAEDPSYIFRRNMAIMAGMIISDQPFTGIGPGQVTFAKEYYDLMDDWDLPVETGYLQKKHLHDMYLHITSEFGFPGLVMFLGIIGGLIWLAVHSIRKNRGLEKGLSYGFLWAVIGVGIGELLDCLLRGPPVAMELFFIAGLIAGITADVGSENLSANAATENKNPTRI